MKKILLFVGLLLSLFLMVSSIIAIFKKEPVKKQGGAQGVGVAPDPKNQTLEKSPKAATYSFAFTPSLDATLPVFTFKKISREQSLKIATNMARQLNITASPSSLLRDDIYTSSWNQAPEKFLQVSISSDASVISFSRAKIVPSESVENSQSIESFLFPITSILDVQVSLERGKETEFDGLLVLDRPLPLPFEQTLVRYVKNSAFLATGDMNLSAGSIITDTNGIIRSATVAFPLYITGAGGNVKTLSADQILESLSEGRGRIISRGKISGKTIGKSPSFSKFTITDIKSFYAPENRLLLPAFILSGDATTDGGVIPIKMFLWNYAASR